MQALDSPVLSALSDRDHRRLVDRAVPRTIAQRQPLFFAGEKCEHVYVVLDGIVKLCSRDTSGAETILALVAAPDLAGDIGALEGTHPTDGIGASRCHVLALDAELFLEVVTSNGAASRELTRSLAARWRRMSEVALERTTGEVPVRLAGRLLELAEVCGHMKSGTIEMQLPLAQEDLGRLAGMCRESTCKALRKFKRAGVVDYKGRRLSILRPDVLRKLTCAGRDATPFR